MKLMRYIGGDITTWEELEVDKVYMMYYNPLKGINFILLNDYEYLNISTSELKHFQEVGL